MHILPHSHRTRSRVAAALAASAALCVAVAFALPGCSSSHADGDTDADTTAAIATDSDTPRPDAWPDPADTVELTDAQWKEKLTADQYYILRQDGTERPGSSPLDDMKHKDTPGDFACAGCNNLLFQTAHKFDSGTGWPSFDRPVGPEHIIEEQENDFMRRVEVRCARCDGHLGHVFSDGPRDTTGLRYCINGDALVFFNRSVSPTAN